MNTTGYEVKKMVNNAEAYLGKKVNNLVITVPPNFNNAQRNCTKQSSKISRSQFPQNY